MKTGTIVAEPKVKTTVEINPYEETVGAGVGFQRIRRITGYLVGTVDRFNNAKRAEVMDRVKHHVSRTVEL